MIHSSYHKIKIMRILKASSPPEWKLFNFCFFFKCMFLIQYFIYCNLFHMFFLPNKINKIWNKKKSTTRATWHIVASYVRMISGAQILSFSWKKILINKLPNNYCIIVISEKHDADNKGINLYWRSFHTSCIIVISEKHGSW